LQDLIDFDLLGLPYNYFYEPNRDLRLCFSCYHKVDSSRLDMGIVLD
jgi:hypothetical protein